jgi:hypothetical protein
MDRTCSTHGDNMNVYTDRLRKHEGKGLLGRSRRRREENIKIDLRAI